MSDRADVIVLGMGIAGELVASGLAEEGLDVIGIDGGLVGGECPYWGCIPTKMMIRAANLLAEARRIPGIAGDVTVTPNWDFVAARIRDEATDDWDDRVAVERYERKGGRFVRGVGRLVAPNSVEVAGQRFEASRGVVLATGTSPVIPPIPGLETVDYWTNRDAVAAKELPESLVVLGGGAIGAELAQVFARFGVRVAIVEALDRLLPLEEPEVGLLLADVLRREGIAVHAGSRVASARIEGDQIAVRVDAGPEIVADRLLVATGRRPDLVALGVANAGLDEHARWISVDARLRAAEGIWAIGDVTGVGPFTHVAVHQARIALDDILGRNPPAASQAIPRVTFTDPEVGSVGLSETAARETGRRVRIGFADVQSSARGWLHKVGNEGFVKLVEDEDRGVLIGATAMGPAGGEVLSMLTLAVEAAIPTRDLRRMIYAYPTFHRAVEDALAALAR
ncbi:MAG: NAD(P)/FAD-dependent oxidoreductase [Acidimicrobiia bacterium]